MSYRPWGLNWRSSLLTWAGTDVLCLIVPDVTQAQEQDVRPLLEHAADAVRLVLISCLVVIVLAGTLQAQEQRDLVGKNMVGVRLGPWLADGLTADFESDPVRLFTSATAFHLEFFYLYQLKGVLYLDLMFGGTSRGDIRIDYQSSTGFENGVGTAGVYPLSVGINLFPLANQENQQIQPFVGTGGSIIIGTETITTSGYRQRFGSFIGIKSESREAIGWYASGGVNWLVSPKIVLTAMGKYQSAKFSKELVGVKDFSGTQILFGAAYAYR